MLELLSMTASKWVPIQAVSLAWILYRSKAIFAVVQVMLCGPELTVSAK
jgi:hypothetical protein